MITILAKDIFFLPGARGGKWPRRLTSRVRGEEVANYLGWQYNIYGKYNEDDTCLWIKPSSLDKVRDQDFVDILDDASLPEKLKLRPKIRVIVYNLPYYEYLKKEIPNELIYIPHHHINLENKTRVKNKPLVGGMIGPSVPLVYKIYDEIKEALGDIDFKPGFIHETREDMLKFYNDIDFQVIWYEQIPDDFRQHFRHPTKIVNAASFGIPTIAQPIQAHEEFEGDYLPATTHEEIVAQVKKLQDDAFYDEFSKRLIKRAEPFHMSKIAELYRRLNG